MPWLGIVVIYLMSREFQKPLTALQVSVIIDYMKGKQAKPRPSTLHVRNYRERMRQQGLVKKDVWIRPEYAEELAAIERGMREVDRDPALPCLPSEPSQAGWSISTIHHAIAQTSAVQQGLVTLDLIEGAEPSLHLQMHAFGDLSVFVAVGGDQIIVESYLWPVAQVMEPADFNAHVLRTHKLIPLSTIALQEVGGIESYTMFGALDTRSSLPSLMLEIESLADNVISFTETYASYLRPLEATGPSC